MHQREDRLLATRLEKCLQPVVAEKIREFKYETP